VEPIEGLNTAARRKIPILTVTKLPVSNHFTEISGKFPDSKMFGIPWLTRVTQLSICEEKNNALKT
jgi:hypothetical protein